ncbi:MAG: ABC transporter permease [Burkholderiaceae bacterium]
MSRPESLRIDQVGQRRHPWDHWRWWVWLALGQWRQSPGRTLTCVASIAIGVGLALAIHLINRSALEEFRLAMATINGESHAQVRAVRSTFPEQAWERLVESGMEGIEQASPVLEADLVLTDRSQGTVRLRLIALDVLSAAEVTPGLLPGAQTLSLLEVHTLALSEAALRALEVRVGETVIARSAKGPVRLTVVAALPSTQAQLPLAVMDLGNAQWLLNQIGQLSRIDLRLAAGAEPSRLEDRLNRLGQGLWLWSTPQNAADRMSNLSRAYRVNLNVLALVALFTGTFLVFSTLALAVARQSPELALLGVLGADARARATAVLMQGLVLGLAGAVIGVLAGIGLAQGVLGLVGGDLGGGYFEGSRPGLHLDALTLPAFGVLGVLTGAAGAWLPARAVARMPVARSLRSAQADILLRHLDHPMLALGLLACGAVLLAMPPIHALPLPAYLAIALWLLAGIASLPFMVRFLCQPALAWQQRSTRSTSVPVWLALHRSVQTPGAIAAGLAGVVASVALASAMGIMVHSFRTSVSEWLDQVLPAPLYARLTQPASASGKTGDGITPEAIRNLRAHPELARLQAMQTLELQARPDEPAIALLVRHTDPEAPLSELPLTGPRISPPTGLIPVWASEPLARRWSLKAGSRLELDPVRPDPQGRFFVTGIWRDYARQHGALAIDATHWIALGGESLVTDLALWPTQGVDAASLPERLAQGGHGLEALQWRSADEIRALSLRIFDRSFAVTYALEAAALLVGLFGVAAACTSDALGRMREFGMLRHFGVNAQRARRQLVLESTLGTTVAVLWGLLLGAAIGWVLIARVNPQSFYWTMQMHLPWSLLLGTSLALISAASLSAFLASRPVLGRAPLNAVRQDS